MTGNLFSAMPRLDQGGAAHAAPDRQPKPMEAPGRLMICPLCKGERQAIREETATSEICRLYGEQLGVDVRRLFSGTGTIAFVECATCGLGHYCPTVTGDGGFYDRLQTESWYYLEAKYEYDFAAKLIGCNANVLDVGSGEGAFARHLPPGAVYTGLDMSSEAIRKAQRNGFRVINEAVESHAAANEGRYDVVVSFQSLEHVTDPRSFLVAAAKCLKSGGKLIVAVPSEDSFLRFASNSPLNMPPHHVTRWSDGALRNLAAIIGMKLCMLHHEPLQDIHRDWALSVMANAMLGRGRRQVEGRAGLTGKITARVASLLSRLLRKRLPRDFWPCGHTVIAVYSK